jgi:DNA modification methylase
VNESLANGRVILHCGDMTEIMKTLPDNSIDSVVTDPPYHLTSIVKRFGNEPTDSAERSNMETGTTQPPNRGAQYKRLSKGFMGKQWDGGDVAFRPETWIEVLRVLKPGGHLIAFSGTRTYHRMACAIEDAGFDIRDQLAWMYGSGFPKSHSVSRNVDLLFRKQWQDALSSIEKLDVGSLAGEWNAYLKIAKHVGVQFLKKPIEIGTSMPKNAFAPALVIISETHKKLNVHAIIAELNLNVAHRTATDNSFFAAANAENDTLEETALVTLVERQFAGENNAHDTSTLFAPKNVLGWQNEKIISKIKAEEALRIWLGRNKSSQSETLNALCATMTSDLKRIILSQSKTFLSLDTNSQMDCVSATNVIITKSTAECLILFMADMLKETAIRKIGECTRKVVGTRKADDIRGGNLMHRATCENDSAHIIEITESATELAKQWEGWGTALKPAWEPCVLARKALIGTVVETVLAHGTGAINVDACKVAGSIDSGWSKSGSKASENVAMSGRNYDRDPKPDSASGRYPANVLHDGSAEVVGMFPYDEYVKGSAARFFYTAKADQDDRLGSKHPTVKPLDLMQYLVRLVTPPGGTVLDCFAGTGTTGEAAYREGFNAVLIERETEYQNDIRRRMSLVLGGKDERKREAIKASGKAEKNAGPLFALLGE